MEPRQAPGKPEGSQRHGFVSTSHTPRVSLRAEHEVAQSPGTQGKFSWVPLCWLSIAPGRILRWSLHLPSTNWGLQTVSSTDNTKGTTSWITKALFSWLHLQICSQKARSGQGSCFFCPISKQQCLFCVEAKNRKKIWQPLVLAGTQSQIYSVPNGWGTGVFCNSLLFLHQHVHDTYLSWKNDSHQGFPSGVTVPEQGSEIMGADNKGMGTATCLVLVSVASEKHNMMTISSFISRSETSTAWKAWFCPQIRQERWQISVFSHITTCRGDVTSTLSPPHWGDKLCLKSLSQRGAGTNTYNWNFEGHRGQKK